MNKLLIPASLDGYSPRKDGSFSLRFATQEMNPSEVANVANLYNQFGFLLFQEKISLEDQELMDSLDVELSDGKTPSQRLRGVLFVSYEQDNRGYAHFKDFYKAKMESIIEKIKNTLE
jgi:hypothetical protein